MLAIRCPDRTEHDISHGITLEVEEASRGGYLLLAPSATSVRLGELPLKRGPHGWLLPIGQWVGATVLCIDGSQRIPIFVKPSADKFHTDTWFAMLEALEAWVPSLTVGLAGGRSGSVGSIGIALPLLTESLLGLLPELVRCLHHIEQVKRVCSNIRIEERSIRRVQTASPSTVAWLGRHPSAAIYLHPNLDDGLPSPQIPLVPILRTEDDVNHPANRYLTWLVGRVQRRLEQCAELWSLHSLGDSDLAVWACERQRNCAEAAAQLRQLLKRSFLGMLTPEPPSDATMLVIAGDPLYGKTHRLARKLLSPLFDPTSDAACSAPVRQSFNVYELWTFLRIQQQLSQTLASAVWTRRRLRRLLRLGGTGTGAQYSAKLPSGRVFTLEFNSPFSSYWARDGKRNRPCRWSLSAMRRPDLVLTARGGDSPARWLFLDAKYSVSLNALGKAFQSVHIYRDSLRDDACGGRCVAGALLAPRRRDDTASWFSNDFFEAHGCGVFELRPDKPDNDVARWVLRHLGGANIDERG